MVVHLVEHAPHVQRLRLFRQRPQVQFQPAKQCNAKRDEPPFCHETAQSLDKNNGDHTLLGLKFKPMYLTYIKQYFKIQ